MKKSTLYIIIAVLLVAVGIGIQISRYNSLNEKYKISVSNNKAYEDQLDEANEKCVAFQFQIDQLNYINDQSIHELDSMRRQLKIKDNKIKLMGKIKEYVYITDTLTLHDTIFCDEEFKLDTTIGDQWYDNCLHLEYPNIISSTISVNTDLNCFLHVTRETVDPPCKTWIGRLFLKKHDVYNVTVIENNPYMKVKENKFVIINE